MERIAIIGAGVSGLTCARELGKKYQVKVFEKEDRAGGLIRCKRVNGSLYHICGGHVFNSKRQDVLDWFWNIFDKDEEFVKAERNSVVMMEDGKVIPYPIENHMFLFEKKIQESFIKDMLYINKEHENLKPMNFEEFLRMRFGNTLYEIYFKPYNEKVWRRDLSQIPLSWLEGKLPMPTVEEVIFNNMNHVKEKQFVHSSFYYEKEGGSQFLADKLAAGIDVAYNIDVKKIEKRNGKWICNDEEFDKVVFCGNIKDIADTLAGIDVSGYSQHIEKLESHGTTSVFCEIDKNEYSWVYQPSKQHESHRIICTGNFSPSNNAMGKMTATIEFTDSISKEEILLNLKQIPFHPIYLDHHYNRYTYPIQDANTRSLISNLKNELSKESFYMTGRFVDWEYYNMDVAIGAALDMCKILNT